MSEISGIGDIQRARVIHEGTVGHQDQPKRSVFKKIADSIRNHPKVAATVGGTVLAGAAIFTPTREGMVNTEIVAKNAAEAAISHVDYSSGLGQPLDGYNSVGVNGEKIPNTYVALLRYQGVQNTVPFTVRKDYYETADEISFQDLQKELGVTPHDQTPAFIQMVKGGKYASGNKWGDQGAWGKLLDAHGKTIGYISANSIDIDPTQPIPTPTQ